MANKANKNNTRGTKPAKKLTKAAVYAAHGIKYDSKTTKILSPMGWICELLKEGNTKVGKTVLTWSTLPGTGEYTAVVNGVEYTEKGTCVCDCVGCYAKTGHYNQPSCIASLVINTHLANNHLDFVENAMSAQIEWAGDCELRTDAAGDFNTSNPEAYTAMMHRIAETYTGMENWTYTKLTEYETLFDDLENANVVRSIIPGVGVNYGHCDYIIKAYRILIARGEKVYICRCGIDFNQHCAGCHVCTKYKYVLFLEHSTGYDAKKDPLYPDLVKLIESQTV